jgi:superfamily II DNA or RNA helicase
MEFPPGTFVRLKNDPTRSGILRDGQRKNAGYIMVPVQSADGVTSWLPLASLEAVPTEAEFLDTRFSQGRFASPEWLRRAIARIRIAGRLSEMVYSMEATETDFYAYQFKPVLKLLSSPTDALLIADEVGLGKTIEAGLIWTELRSRFQYDRLLVLCPKTLCPKWQDELKTRFGVDAQIVNASELLRKLKMPRGNGSGFAAIASMQSIRPPKGWDDELEESEVDRPDVRTELARLLEDAAEGDPIVDLLIVDEAHHMRNPETMLHKLGSLANSATSYRIYLSATPIHLKNRDLHSLLKLIDPETFEFQSALEELIAGNKPIIEARDMLLNPSVHIDKVLEKLSDARSEVALQNSRSLELIEADIRARKSLDYNTRAEFAGRMEQVSLLANYVTRTRRRDVQEFRVIRDPSAPVLKMTSVERRFYDEIKETVCDYALSKSLSERFLLASAERLLTSSPAAASGYWSNAHSANNLGEEDEDSDLDGVVLDERPLVSRLKEKALSLGLTRELELCDTKFTLLLDQLYKVWEAEPEAKIVLFSSFKATLNYLFRRLKEKGVTALILHGSIKEPRESTLSKFKSDDSVRLLLSSEIGSEGVDLQFCWIVVNYDLPWNPMRLEQRVGRIDRLGQKKEKIKILNLIYSETIDEYIYTRLYERLGIASRALGEFETVLGAAIHEMTIHLLDPTLTEEDRIKVVETTAQAIANLKKEEEKLEEEAGSLIRHGDYILQKITETRDLNRWIRADDIFSYVKDRIYSEFPGSVIETSPPGSNTFQISLSDAAREEFSTYIVQRGLRGQTRLLDGNDKFRYEFSSSIVKRFSGGVEVISQVHPLVRFVTELDEQRSESRKNEPVAVRIRKSALNFELPGGIYVVAMRLWKGATNGGRSSGFSRLAYAGGSLQNEQSLTSDISEALAAAAIASGEILLGADRHPLLTAATSMLRDTVLAELESRFSDYIAQIGAEVIDRAGIRRRAIERHLSEKAAIIEEQIRNFEYRYSALAARGEAKKANRLFSLALGQKSKLTKLKASCEMRLREIEFQKNITPEEQDVSALLVEVEA